MSASSGFKSAEQYASEGSDPLEGGSSGQARGSHNLGRSNQMENDLEISKSNKPSTDNPEEVAGRHGKGLAMADKLTSGFEKLTGKK